MKVPLNNGTVLEFPDGTDPAIVKKAVDEVLAQEQPAPMKVPLNNGKVLEFPYGTNPAIVKKAVEEEEQPGIRDILSNFNDSLANGLTGGFYDELIKVPIQTGVDKVFDLFGAPNKPGMGEGYAANLEAAGKEREAAKESMPYTSYGGEIIGAAISPLFKALMPAKAALPLGGRVVQSSLGGRLRELGGRAAQSSLGGARIGSVYGAGNAEGDVADRVEGAGGGALIGGAAGGLLQPLVEVVPLAGKWLSRQFGFGGRAGARAAAEEPYNYAVGRVGAASADVPVTERAVQTAQLAENAVRNSANRVTKEAGDIAAALQAQEAALPAVTKAAANARAAGVSSADDVAAAQRLLDAAVHPVLPPVPSRTAVGKSAQSQLAAAKKLLEETQRAEAAAARVKVDSEATNLESKGRYIGDTPAAQDLLEEIDTVLSPSPSTVSPTAMRLEQRSTDVVTLNRRVEAALKDKKVFLNEAQAKEARDLGYTVELEPSSLGKDGALIPGEEAVYSRTLKSGYEAVDEVGRFLGQVYEGTAARGYDAIAAAEARRLYNRIQDIKRSYLPKGVQDKFNKEIQRLKAAEDAFFRQGAGGGAVERAGNIERPKTLPVAELDKILSETASLQNFARAVGAEGDASAAALVEQEIARKLSGLDSAGIKNALASKESLGDIFTNLDKFGEAGLATKGRIQRYINSVAERERLARVLGSANEENVAAATALTKAETTLTKATADLEKARIASQKAQDAVGATEKTINIAADEVAAREADVTKAKDLVATRKSEASRLDPARAEKEVDELIKNLGKNLEERSNLSVDTGGLSREQIKKAAAELKRVKNLRDNVNRNKQLAKILAIYGGVPAAGVSTGIYVADR